MSEGEREKVLDSGVSSCSTGVDNCVVLSDFLRRAGAAAGCLDLGLDLQRAW